MAPYVELEPTDHPLAIEQRNGITLERVKKIKKLYNDIIRLEKNRVISLVFFITQH